MKTKEPQDLRSGIPQEEEVQLEKPHHLRKGDQEEIEPQKIQEQEKVEAIPTLKEKVSKIYHMEIEPHIELMGEENKTIEPKVDIEPLVLIEVEITELQQGRQMFRKI